LCVSHCDNGQHYLVLFSLGLSLDATANQNKETEAMLTSMKLFKKNNNTLLSLNRTTLLFSFKIILHQFWVKTISPWKFNLEYGGTFTKLLHDTDRFLNNYCQECVRAYLSIHDIFLFFTRSWSAIIGPKFSPRGYDRQSSEQNTRKLISVHNNGKDDKLAHGFAVSCRVNQFLLLQLFLCYTHEYIYICFHQLNIAYER
jgi:hypothetical protein